MQYRATATHPQPLSALGFGCMPCPQGIDIPTELARATKKLEPAVYRVAAWGAKKLRRF